jgi:AcrR family transcriptional regulator
VSATAPGRARARSSGVRPPRPLLAPETERRLTERQRQVLGELEGLVASEDLAELTMAELARRVNCSLRTLYGIAPSKDELVLAAVDRRLHRIGRRAIAALDADLSPLAAVRAYLQAAHDAVQPTTAAFARDFARVPGAQRLLDAHEGYVVAVTRSLLERAVEEGEIARVDTAALAHVLGGLGREFSRPEVAEATVASTPKETADAIMEIILRGLPRGRRPRPARPRSRASG